MPTGIYSRISTEERFWSKVDKRGPDECWLWQTGMVFGGYGKFFDGKIIRAHRYAYQLLVGPVPEGLELDHLCRVRNCVNPAHLEAVTHQENCQRGIAGYGTVPTPKSSQNRQYFKKTHCPQGHPYDLINTYINPTTVKGIAKLAIYFIV